MAVQAVDPQPPVMTVHRASCRRPGGCKPWSQGEARIRFIGGVFAPIWRDPSKLGARSGGLSVLVDGGRREGARARGYASAIAQATEALGAPPPSGEA
jgi:hypothetical protein